MDLGTDGRRMAIEIIATLVHLKHPMAELLLKPAGVPPEIYGNLLYAKEPVTGKTLSKRKIAPLILDALTTVDGGQRVVRTLIEIAAHWSSFHLADDEYVARATAQKARELLGILELMEAREAKQRALAKREELARMERERAELIQKQSELLLMMFDALASSEDPQRRGYLLQDLLNRAFDLHQIPVVRSFTRNGGGEQIDGAFKLDGWHYLVECRWRKKLADIRELDGLKGEIGRSGKQTMGLFLSINGWSDNVCPLLRQNPDKSIVLMEGYDLRTVLAGRVDLREFILAKVGHLNLEADPFLSITAFLAREKEM